MPEVALDLVVVAGLHQCVRATQERLQGLPGGFVACVLGVQVLRVHCVGLGSLLGVTWVIGVLPCFSPWGLGLK